MSYLGQFTIELKAVAEQHGYGPLGAKLSRLVSLLPLALGEATTMGKRDAEAAIKVKLTGTKGMSTEGLQLMTRIHSEYLCCVSILIGTNGWGCRIVCPDTDGTGVAGYLDPESALLAAVAKWSEKVKKARPHLAGLAIP